MSQNNVERIYLLKITNLSRQVNRVLFKKKKKKCSIRVIKKFVVLAFRLYFKCGDDAGQKLISIVQCAIESDFRNIFYRYVIFILYVFDWM